MLPKKFIIGAGPVTGSTTDQQQQSGGNGDSGSQSQNDQQQNQQQQNQQSGDRDAATAVATAYAKLREREDEVKTLKSDIKAKDQQLSEMDTIKNENTSLKEANGKLTSQLQEFAVTGTATTLGFVAPKYALGILQQSAKLKPEEFSDEKKVEAALKEIATENPGLVTGGVVPPGNSGANINPAGGGNNAGGDAGFNSMIRRAAGRA